MHLDLSAVFDRLDHNFLLQRLQQVIGIKGTAFDWFKYFLSDRFQFVHVRRISFEWCYGVCCPLFSVFSNPSWSRQMATLPESGSARGFFLLKGSRFSPQSPRARSGREICILLVSLARKCMYVWIGLILNLMNWIMITINFTLTGLNWTVSLKRLERTFVMIWRYISKLNWIKCVVN